MVWCVHWGLCRAGDGQTCTDGLFSLGREAASDANLTFYEGGAGDGPFTGLCCAPRVWNGTFLYDL